MSRTRHPRPQKNTRSHLNHASRLAYLIRQTSRPIVRNDRVAAKETPERIASEPELLDYEYWDG